MSKKIAEGSNAVVLDVKCGSGAFMKRREDALLLARSLVAIGTANGVRTEAFITNMDAPLGTAVGNALEIAECIETLSGRGPRDLESLIVRLATRMVQLGQRAQTDADAEALVRGALASGAALDKLRQMVVRQGGDAAVIDDPRRLPQARHHRDVVASAAGFIAGVDAEAVGRATVLLGAGRERVDGAIDLAAGARVLRKPGDAVRAGDSLVTLFYNDDRRLDDAMTAAQSAFAIAPTPPVPMPMVWAWVHEHGETSYL
jgi:thymidine phosphorylase